MSPARPTPHAPTAADEFDGYAGNYDETLDRALEATGEDRAHFARARVQWLARRLARHEAHPRTLLDYGCGNGAATPFFFESLGVTRTDGVDVSPKSIDAASRMYGSARSTFSVLTSAPTGLFDLAFCNGVFHHIPLDQRAGAVAYVKRALTPGGLWAFWENNPWNPGTRLVMRRLEFDRDAITLSPPDARRLLTAGGFEILETTAMFIFPSALKALRPLEPLVCRIPAGGQYLVLARKPAGASPPASAR
jgi:SAM-dependent methyltransferase